MEPRSFEISSNWKRNQTITHSVYMVKLLLCDFLKNGNLKGKYL